MFSGRFIGVRYINSIAQYECRQMFICGLPSKLSKVKKLQSTARKGWEVTSESFIPVTMPRRAEPCWVWRSDRPTLLIATKRLVLWNSLTSWYNACMENHPCWNLHFLSIRLSHQSSQTIMTRDRRFIGLISQTLQLNDWQSILHASS